MEQKIDLLLSKLDNLEKNMNENFSQVNTRLDKLEEGQEALKKDIKNLSIITGEFATRFDTIDSEIVGVNRKLDRLSAKQDIFSATVKEHELRLEDLEFSPPVK